MERARSTTITQATAATEQKAGDAQTAAGPHLDPSDCCDFTIERSLDALLRSTANVLSSADEINRLVAELALERERMVRELEGARREQEVLRAHVRQLKVAVEVELAEMRERARRESQAILAEAQLVRDRARDNAKRLEARLIATEKQTRTVLRGLIASAEAAEMARAQLDMDAKYYSVDQPVSLAQDAEQMRSRVTSSPPCSAVTAHSACTSMRQESASIDLGDSSCAPSAPPDVPLADDPNEATERYVLASQDDTDEQTTWAASEQGGVGPEVSQIEPAEEPTLDRVGVLAPFCYQVLIGPVQSFSKIEELETLLREIDAVENVSLVALQPQGATFEVTAQLSHSGLLGELASRLPHAKAAAVGSAGIELQLRNSTEANCQ